MTFDVSLDMEPMTLDVELGQITDLSASEKKEIYQSGYDSGRAEEQSVTGGIIERSISGAYRNDRIAKIGQYAFRGCTQLTDVETRNAVSIGQNAFQLCSSLTTVIAPLAEEFGQYAFYYCRALSPIQAPSVKTVGNYCFQGCSALESAVYINATFVGTYAFSECQNLTYAELKNASIAGYCFAKSGLTTLVIRGDASTLVNVNALSLTPIADGTGYIYVPDDLVDRYKTATNWSTYADQIKPLSELEG